MDCKFEYHSDDDFDSSSNGFGDHNGNTGFTTGQTPLVNTNGLSKAELRKTNKPIMEKRRRARINRCLNELKSLILEAMKKDPARHTKLEKADILEMTVKHLQSVQRQQLHMAIQADPTVIHKFKTGFVECADEVNRYISQLDNVDASVRQRLTNHLNNCATSLEQIGSMSNFNRGYRGQLNVNASGSIFGASLAAAAAAAAANPLVAAANPLVAAANPLLAAAPSTPAAAIFPTLPHDFNNNNSSSSSSSQAAAVQMGGVQLIPSRLPSGEFALIMPNATASAIAGGVPVTGSGNLLGGGGGGGGAPGTLPFPAVWPAAPAIGAARVPPPPQQPTTTTTAAAAAISSQLKDFSTSFQRGFSAFSKPAQKSNNNNGNTTNTTSSPYTSLQQLHHPSAAASLAFHQPAADNLHQNSTAAASPPLSPISSAASVSSHGDDSSLMHTSSDFNTPSRPTTPPTHDSLRAPNSFSGVFSTPSSTESSSLNSSRSSTHLQQQQVSSTSGSELQPTSKRSRSELADSNDSSEEKPSAKKFASSERVSEQSMPVSDEERDSMWRPW